MTIMAHPNPDNVERYRVLDKALGVQEYFSVKQLGKREALKQAKARQAELDERRGYRAMMAGMAIAKLFDDEGAVKGLRRKYRKRNGRADYECLTIQVTVAEKVQKGSEISLAGRSFDEAYQLVQQKLCELHGVELNREIKQMFADTKYRYQRSVKPK